MPRAGVERLGTRLVCTIVVLFGVEKKRLSSIAHLLDRPNWDFIYTFVSRVSGVWDLT